MEAIIRTLKYFPRTEKRSKPRSVRPIVAHWSGYDEIHQNLPFVRPFEAQATADSGDSR
jgi:hypothetical protein